MSKRNQLPNILLITPPFTQLNTPYPATAYIKGFLQSKSVDSFQMDLGIEVILELFSTHGLTAIFQRFPASKQSTENAQRIYCLRHKYVKTVEPVTRFLQGKLASFARQICSYDFLPRASRFEQLADLNFSFGEMGFTDQAKHLATLYLEDLSDYIVELVDPDFGFSRYAERLGRSANSFDQLYSRLVGTSSYIDEITLRILNKKIEMLDPDLVCFSVPFPGNLYSAFKCAQFIKSKKSNVKIAMGGGFPNTELRSLTDIRVFEFFDYISLDDGELPLELIVSNIIDPSPENPDHNLFKRTFILENEAVLYNNFSLRSDYKQHETGTPDYTNLLLDKYISVIEIANPMHSLWSDGRWNKLTMAHGCYWGKCTFCDISLDYISQYQPVTASLLVDRMEQMIKATGENGFHFVDEAAPPALMRDVAIEILKRGLVVSWWTNIRFEKSFTLDLCRLLKASGCIAISGGLEVASDRLLKLIKKGVTVKQVAQVTRNLTESGIMVHAYLMYGYPTQTVQETIDSLEMVRQLFEQDVLQSGFWHQFALTAHSPVGMDPESYHIDPIHADITFANNDVDFTDRTGIDHNKFSYGLKKSLYNFMHGICLDYELQEWFDFKIPKTSIDSNYIATCLDGQVFISPKDKQKLIWLHAGMRLIASSDKSKKVWTITIEGNENTEKIVCSEKMANWLDKLIHEKMSEFEVVELVDFRGFYEEHLDDFTLFWYGEEMQFLRDNGLLIL